MKKCGLNNKFLLGFLTGTILLFIYGYLVWPRELPRDGKLQLSVPITTEKEGIYYPVDGTKVTGGFLVYGAGEAFENEGLLVLTDTNDQEIKTLPVSFQPQEPGTLGLFATIFPVSGLDPSLETGKLKLFRINPQSGEKEQIGDFVNLRFK